MFPSMHDITPAYLQTYKNTLRNLLQAGNQVLIVTKPRLAIIQELCNDFSAYREQIIFRFTITSITPTLAAYWEPGAPLPQERMDSLIHAHGAGFKTSVSVEPMIDTLGNTIILYRMFSRYITEDIWFGKMNGIYKRVWTDSDEDCEAVLAITESQSDENILYLHQHLKAQPKVKWKDSIRLIVEKAA
jgi:DNA repair photolyase